MNAPRAKRNVFQEVLVFISVIVVVSILIAALARWSLLRDDIPPGSVTAEAEISPHFRPRPTTVARGIHLLGGLFPSVAYAIETTDGIVLIDTGVEADCRSLLPQLVQLGLHPRDIRLILLTHAHGDHALGAEYLRDSVNAKIYAGVADSQVLADGGPPEAIFSYYRMPGIEAHPTTVDVELAGGEEIVSGDTHIQALATPGHSPGSMCFLLERDGRRLLFSGDTIMTLTGELGTYASYLPSRYRGSAEDFLATLRSLQAMPAPHLILPGHPYSESDASPDDLQSQDPTVTPAQWQAILQAGINEMEKLIVRFKADGRDFLDGEAKELLPDLYYLGNHDQQAVYCLHASSELLLFGAPGGPELVSFVETRLSQFGLELSDLSTVLLTDAYIQATSGLAAVARKTGCRVVTSASMQAGIAKVCPAGTQVNSPDQLADILPIRVEAIPLAGLSTTPLAYLLECSQQSVLISAIPVNVTPNQEPVQVLLSSLDRPKVAAAGLLDSLDRLEQLHPDLWLASRPASWQNANLYDEEWRETITTNRRAIERYLRNR